MADEHFLGLLPPDQADSAIDVSHILLGLFGDLLGEFVQEALHLGQGLSPQQQVFDFADVLGAEVVGEVLLALPQIPANIVLHVYIIVGQMMSGNCRRLLSTIRRLKAIEPESWVVQPADSHKAPGTPSAQILNYKDIKNSYKRGLQEEPRPVVHSTGPLRVANPKIAGKTYRWCACGMSSTQPFCDGSHEGTLFKPVRFTVEQRVDWMELCGCKHSSKKPFCDGEACRAVREGKPLPREPSQPQ